MESSGNLSLAVLLVAGSLSMLAKDKHLPLPPQLMAATTVYIDNRSGFSSMGDRAYQEITDWGRFHVVQDRSQADIILLLTYHSETHGSRQHGRVDENGNIQTTSTPNVYQYSGLNVLDAKTGDVLWTDSKAASLLQKSAIKRAIDELRKRMEEQAAKPKP